MKYLLFRERFVTPIWRGVKRQTVRGRAHVAPGEWLSLRRWLGEPYRSTQGEICPPVLVTRVEPVRIGFIGKRLGIVLSGELLTETDVERFAIGDGFGSARELADDYADGGFEGVVIRWAGESEARAKGGGS